MDRFAKQLNHKALYNSNQNQIQWDICFRNSKIPKGFFKRNDEIHSWFMTNLRSFYDISFLKIMKKKEKE